MTSRRDPHYAVRTIQRLARSG
ncbi:hypothetical protein ABTI09_19790, partial [Acinetobacter baumannii]